MNDPASPPADEEALFESAPCGYLITDPDGRIMRVNRGLEALTGYSRGELVGQRRFIELLSVGARIYHDTHYAPLLQLHDRVEQMALELRRLDGSLVPVLINSALHRDPAGAPEFIQTMVFDSSERHRYEQELREARVRERAVADELQHALLAGDLPSTPRVEIAQAYRAAVRGQDAGGDWHDAFWIDESAGTMALVVGDVVGHGITAAAIMGQLRSAIRALALDGHEPGTLLRRLDRYVLRHQVGAFATVAYTELDLGTRKLRYACAGHPPPIIIPRDAEPIVAWDGRSPPLAATFNSLERTTASVTLPAQATALLYTDGLVERRGEAFDVGLTRLTERVRLRRDQRPGDLVNGLIGDLHDRAYLDDVCLLAARLS